MDKELYKLVFRGEIAPGQNIEDVKRKLATLYKLDIAKVEQNLFTGKTIVVKKNLDYEAACKLQKSLTARTGAIFDVKAIVLNTTKKASERSLSQTEAVSKTPSEPPREQVIKEKKPHVTTPEKEQPESPSAHKIISEPAPSQDSSTITVNVEERVGFGRRFGALLFDVVLIVFLSVPLGFLTGFLGAYSYLGLDSFHFERTMWFVASSLAACVVFGFLYYLREGVAGASFGKKVFKITVANINGSKAGIGTLLGRCLLKNVPYLIAVAAGFFGKPLLEAIGVGIAGIMVVGCFSVFGAKKQALHDMLLKTAVYPQSVLQRMSPPKSATLSHNMFGALGGLIVGFIELLFVLFVLSYMIVFFVYLFNYLGY